MISATSRLLVLVDAAVQDYQHFTAHLPAEADVAILEPHRDGIAQISQLLSDRHNLGGLCLIAHGQPGELQLGQTRLSTAELPRYAALIRGWAAAFQQQATLWIYGCQVAAGSKGQQLVQALHDWVEVSVAASTTLLGNAAQGGNGSLDFAIGQAEPPHWLSAETLGGYPHLLPILVNESFRNSDVLEKQWIFGNDGGSAANPFLTARPDFAAPTGGLPGGGGIDPEGNGVLRLTNNTTNQAAFVIYNQPFSSNAGLSITFDFFAYNGTGTQGATPGGDGISFFLIDGAATPTTAGAFGGSLGYAQKNLDQINGILGGYLGVGLDEFGNFANPKDFAAQVGDQRVGGPGLTPDAVTIRGRGDGTAALGAGNYDFIATSGSLAGGIDEVTTTVREDAARRARVDITPAGILSVKIDLNNDGDFADADEAPTALSNIDIAAANSGIPSSFKFGFASSTGNATNIHEVRNLIISSFSTPPTVVDASLGVSPDSIVAVTGLAGTDAETSIASFTITSLPLPAQGVLYFGNPQLGGTPVTVGQTLTPAQLSQLFFQASPNFTGGSFTYRATDTDGDLSQAPGTITLTLLDNIPPSLPGNSSTNVTSDNPLNLGGLNGTDPDGSINSYIISEIPPANQGSLFVGDPSQGGTPVVLGQTLTPQQLNQLFFRPGAGFTGTQFTYVAVDNRGALSNPRTITLADARQGIPETPECEPGLNRKGTNGNNQIVGTPDSDRLRGLGGNDRLRGKACDDRLDGGKGNDRLFGNDDNDRLRGQQNNDRLDGGKGADLLNGGLGRDRLRGRNGEDTLFGRRGNDRLQGGAGIDRLLGGRGQDRLRGGGGNDQLDGQQNNDRVDGGNGNDVANGGLGNDRLFGRAGDDTLFGRRGNDRLKAGSGEDTLAGGLGNDTLIGGGSADTLSGGGGRDRFIYRNIQHGLDTILDFEAVDRMVLKGIFAKADYNRTPRFDRYIRLVASGSDTIVRVDGNGDAAGGFQNLATLISVAPSDLSASNFVI
jgi:Ca2+-binding RTX toxin-like protein